jgi:hypothetical protein
MMPHAPKVNSMYGADDGGCNSKSKPLDVSDDVASALQNFMCGFEAKPKDANASGDNDKKAGEMNDLDTSMNDKAWVHFQPLKTMRSGVPYHRLQVEEKLNILEFLIDELLQVGTISAEFTKRQTITDCYSFPYGTLPTEAEYENLENEDECGVCHGEGELLCCDGCVSSYHRGCLDMSPGQALPEGKWLCPECKLVDPSMFGPLRGGRKASLDWFSIDDVQGAIKNTEMRMLMEQQQQNFLALSSNPIPIMNTPAMGHTGFDPLGVGPNVSNVIANQPVSSNIENITIVKTVDSSNGLPTPKTPTTGEDALAKNLQTHFGAQSTETIVSDHTLRPSSETQQAQDEVARAVKAPPEPESVLALPQTLEKKASSFEGVEFLTVHGFVFCRKRHDESVDELSEKKPQDPYLVLPKGAVDKYLKEFGSEISNAWPFAQIPSNGTSSAGHFPSARLYLVALDSFDPSFYNSKYRKAPVPLLMKAGGGSQIARLMSLDYESECSQSSTYRVTQALIRDLSLDNQVSKCLKSQLSLFDPYQMIKGYMVRLDTLLNKACLMNEFWDTGKERTRNEIWLCNVRKCRSVNRLARLLLKLVDQVHPRAFEEGWFHNSLAKSSESVTILDRNYKDLPTNWNEKDESRKRLWERTPSQMMLGLCAKEGCSLEEFVQGIRAHIDGPVTVTRSKRKQTKPADSARKDSPLEVRKNEETPRPLAFNQVAKGNAEEEVATTAPMTPVLPGASEKASYPNTPVEINGQVGTFSADDKAKATPGGKDIGIGEDKQMTDADPKPASESSSTPKKVDVGSRRSTRRSGRFSIHSPEPTQLDKAVPSSVSETKKSRPVFRDLEMQIGNFKKLKVPEIEKLVKGAFAKDMEWPVAGRLPFTTLGNLSPREMKRLARNAGVVKAPYVAYNTIHEVGQICWAHVWRKRTEQCSGFEELVHQIRVLESFLDRPVRIALALFFVLATGISHIFHLFR